MAKNVTTLAVETLQSLDGTENVVMFDSAEGKRSTLSTLSDYAIKKHKATDMTQTIYEQGETLKQEITELKAAVGTPLVANTASAMTDQTKIYVYTGAETGYSQGHWYYWNGSAWTDGGVYQATAVETDKTLTLSDKPADSKTVGDALATKATPTEVDSKISENIDSTLSVSGQSADAKVTGDSLKAKAEAEGAVAMAKALVGGKYTLDQSPYHYRQSPDAGALDEKIVGGTLAWNQLYDSLPTSTQNDVTVTYQNGVVSLSGTSTGNCFFTKSISLVAGHKMLICGGRADSVSTTSYLYVSHDSKYENLTGGKISAVFAIESSSTIGVTIRVSSGFDTIGVKYVPQLIDLTALFGPTIADYIYSLEQSSAGAGVAWVRQYIDLDTYHEYCEPTLKSVEGLVSRDVVGKNLSHIAKTTSGTYTYYNPIGGDTITQISDGFLFNTTAGRGISILMGKFKKGDVVTHSSVPSSNLYRFGYSSDIPSESVSYITQTIFQNVGNKNGSWTITCPEDGYYWANYYQSGQTMPVSIMYPQTEYGSTATPYEPYEKHSYPLDSSVTLQGIPKLDSNNKLCFDGDIYPPSGEVARRYMLVDLGTLTYTKNTASSYSYYACREADIPDRKVGSSLFLCSKYITVSPDRDALASGDKMIASYNSGNSKAIVIRDDSFSDASALKTALSGTYLVYEKATPTTETAQPFQSPQLAGSTEEYVTTGVVPVGHESRYYEDITGKVNNLPSDFSTLIAPVEKSFVATRNYTVGSFVIVNNQLYKVTSAISSGGTITPNSNCTATTIMAEILALA